MGWSFGMMPSIDGDESGPGLFGFQDTVAGIANPQLANYTPRSSQAEMEQAFRTRWMHGLNTQAPWGFVKAVVANNYAKFSPIPWFIGEYGANGQLAETIQSDLEDMEKLATEEGSNFLGAAFFQFQTAHFKGGSELNFGVFKLGSEKLTEISAPCDDRSHDCPKLPVYCLSPDLSWLPGTMANRASAVAAAWHGTTEGGQGLCATTSETGMPPLAPLRGIAYGALPCKAHACSDTGPVSEDMLQDMYSKQWGADGRDDLGIIGRLGANAVRLYYSLGLDTPQNHGGFLDHAQAVGLNVMPGYHTNGNCPKFDCFETWKQSTLQGFRRGFQKGSNWHPAVSALILLNEPDFFGGYPQCLPRGAWCRVKAVLSAMDGVLAAEREAGVEPGRVRLTVTWSFGMMPSIDGEESGPGLFGFQDTVAGIANPQLANYTPRSSQAEMEQAFRTRWMHGLNTQAPWGFVKAVVANNYAKFSPIPWFIGEYGA